MVCKNCGAEYNGNFCNFCGAKNMPENVYQNNNGSVNSFNVKGYVQPPIINPQPPKKKNNSLSIVIIILSCVLVVGIVAFAVFYFGNSENEKTDETTSSQTEETINEINSDVKETSKSTTTKKESTTKSSGSKDIGTRKGYTYENETMGLGVKLDSSWTFMSEEDIKSSYETGSDLLGQDSNAATASSVVMTASESGGCSFNMTVAYSSYSISDGLNASKKMFDDSLESAGMTVKQSEISKVTVDGKTYDALIIEYNLMGIDLSQCILGKKVGNYLYYFTITGNNSTSYSDLLEYVYAVD